MIERVEEDEPKLPNKNNAKEQTCHCPSTSHLHCMCPIKQVFQNIMDVMACVCEAWGGW